MFSAGGCSGIPLEATMKLKTVLTFFGVTGLIALAAALLNLWGHLYSAAYFGYYGLSLSMFDLPHEYYLLAAWEHVLYALGAICLGFFAYRLVRWLGTKDGDFQRLGARFPQATAALRSFVSVVGPGAMALFIFLCLICTTLHIINQGRWDARAMARDKREIQFEKFGGELKSPLYFLAYAGGKYVVYTRPDEKADAQVYVLNEAEVGRVSFKRR
jgi:hypothetical protein